MSKKFYQYTKRQNKKPSTSLFQIPRRTCEPFLSADRDTTTQLQQTIGNHTVGCLIQSNFLNCKRILRPSGFSFSGTSPIQRKVDSVYSFIQNNMIVQKSTLAPRAEQIVQIAQNTEMPLRERAVLVVERIIEQYFPSYGDRVREIKYRRILPGFDTDIPALEVGRWRPRGGGTATTAVLFVSRAFIQNTVPIHFARRVQQVRHELEHIDQYRQGMAGRRRRYEREFLAHYHGVHFSPPPGTGRIQNAMRVRMIDTALGYFHCLNRRLQEQHRTQFERLLFYRPLYIQRSRRRPEHFGSVPTSCTR